MQDYLDYSDPFCKRKRNSKLQAGFRINEAGIVLRGPKIISYLGVGTKQLLLSKIPFNSKFFPNFLLKLEISKSKIFEELIYAL